MKRNIELIYDAYEKSRHGELIKKFCHNKKMYILIILFLFFCGLLYLSYNGHQHVYYKIGYLIFVCIFFIYVLHERNSINKEINDNIVKGKKYQSFSSDSLKKLYENEKGILIGTKYSQLIYFQYLISKLNLSKSELNDCYRDLSFKTKDYVKLNEKSSVNAMIALFISLGVLSLDKFVITKIVEWSGITYSILLIFIVVLLFLILSIYDLLSIFERKIKKEKNIKDDLGYTLSKM